MEEERYRQIHEEITSSMARSRELLERVYESVEKTRRYIFWIKVLTIVKFVTIVVALVLFVALAGPSLNKVMDIYTGGAL